jgi:hypothetical protein
MRKFTMSALAATAIGTISLGSAAAIPLDSVLATLVQNPVQDVRVVCDRYGRCYNTRRVYRGGPRYYSQRYYYNEPYYAAPAYPYGYPYGYYDGLRVGIGIGPFGFGIW